MSNHWGYTVPILFIIFFYFVKRRIFCFIFTLLHEPNFKFLQRLPPCNSSSHLSTALFFSKQQCKQTQKHMFLVCVPHHVCHSWWARVCIASATRDAQKKPQSRNTLHSKVTASLEYRVATFLIASNWKRAHPLFFKSKEVWKK